MISEKEWSEISSLTDRLFEKYIEFWNTREKPEELKEVENSFVSNTYPSKEPPKVTHSVDVSCQSIKEEKPQVKFDFSTYYFNNKGGRLNKRQRQNRRRNLQGIIELVDLVNTPAPPPK